MGFARRFVVSLAATWAATWIVVTTVLIVPSPAQAFQLSDQFPPEIATGDRQKPLVEAGEEMVVSANPAASRAGEAMLARGGNAIDAAIAVQLVLGLVEPQSSGLGGGAFL